MLGTPSIRRAFSFGISLTAASSLIGACGGDDEQQINLAKLSQGCSLNSQCENPLVCTFEHCHRQCDDDRDCRGEERCVKGTSGHVCQLPADTACTTDKDCNGAQVCGVDKECRDKCTADTDCTTGQVCAQSGECASKDPNKDKVDGMGNITPDPFDDTKDSGAGGASGAGGSSGIGGSSGSDGSGGSGTGGMDASPDSSVGGTAGATGTGGAGGTAGASGTGGAGTGGTAGSSTDGGVDAGCPAGTGECDGNPNTVCETSLALPTSCGGCTTSCNPQNGTVHCDATTYRCVVDSCTANYDNCDNDGSNGCESRLNDNPNHCGRCGRSCGGGACTNSNCGAETVMDLPGTSGGYLYDIVLAGNRIVASVYIGTEYQLRTVTLPPTAPPSEGTVLHNFFANANERKDKTLVTDGTYVYWSNAVSPYTVVRKPLDNTAANPVEMLRAPSNVVLSELFLTPTAFYFQGNVSSTYGFYTAAKALGQSAQAISGLNNFTPTSTPNYNIGTFMVAGNRIFWAGKFDATTDAILSAPVGGGSPDAGNLIASVPTGTNGYFNSHGLTSDQTHVYWSVYDPGGAGRIRRAPLATPTTAQDVALSVAYPKTGMAVDDTYIYFMDNGNVVYRSKKDGSEAKQRVAGPSGQQYLTAIAAADANYLYGPGYANGSIVRITKTP